MSSCWSSLISRSTSVLTAGSMPRSSHVSACSLRMFLTRDPQVTHKRYEDDVQGTKATFYFIYRMAWVEIKIQHVDDPNTEPPRH